MNKDITYHQALLRATSLCSSTEYCTSQMKEKLVRWGLSPSEVEEAISYLLEEKYIDHARFSAAYVRDKFRHNRWGRIKISQMLRLLHIDAEDIRTALNEISTENYLQCIRHTIRQKDATLKDSDPYTRRAKVVRHLLSRGFETELILDCMEEE